jgi:hypothetical protein
MMLAPVLVLVLAVVVVAAGRTARGSSIPTERSTQSRHEHWNPHVHSVPARVATRAMGGMVGKTA